MIGKKVLLTCFGMAFAAFLLSPTKASAKLTLDSVNYDESTITVTTDSKDSVLYFSDKKMKKWDSALSHFSTDEETGVTKCIMDISWVAVTKDYEITLKGDQSKADSDVLHVTIPKQVKNFKAKYDKKTGEVVFTNNGSRKVQYRKKNTTLWLDVEDDENPKAFSNALQYLRDNGSSVYFRLKAENGSNGSAGQRYSKEVVCSIAKKSNAPKIKINADTTISVESGLQVRLINMNEINGVKRIAGFNKIDSANENEVDKNEKWYTYKSSKDVPIFEMSSNIAPPETPDGKSSSSDETYLQFRKAGTSSSQVSRITTVKIPRQEIAPTQADAGLSIEYTSSTTFKLTFAKATTKNQYEYCIVENSDVKKKDGVVDPSDPFSDSSSVKWIKSSSSVSATIKKANAPDNSWIFFRKKSVGTLGDDDFRLPSAIQSFGPIGYPSSIAGTITLPDNNKTFEVIDGECTLDNSDRHLQFAATVSYGAIVSEIRFSTSENPTSVEEATAATATVTSTKKKDKNNYIVTTNITSLTLTKEFNEYTLSSNGKLELYGYVVFDVGGSEPVYITSNKTSGLRINVSPKSEIVTPDGSDPKNKVNVTHLIGVTSGGAIHQDCKDFNFKINYGTSGVDISKIKLGNYDLTVEDGHYSVSKNGNTATVTINLLNLEKDSRLVAYYGTTQNLTVELANGTNIERLKSVTIRLIEPVSLKQTYSWAFSKNSLPDTTITDENGVVTTTSATNKYSVEYAQTDEFLGDISVSRIQPIRAELNGVNIMDNASNNKIEFSNTKLKSISSCTCEPVNIAFIVYLRDGNSYVYYLNHDCIFTIL